MQILLQNFAWNKSTVCKNPSKTNSSLAPLARDTVSFGALKKNNLDVFDRSYADMAKAPLEKFKTTDDYNVFARENLNNLFEFERYKGPSQVVTDERNKILQEWKDYLQEENNIYIEKPSLSAIIFSGVVKDLAKDNANLPPRLNKGVLSETVEQIEEILKNSKSQINFNKSYQNNLRMFYTVGSEKSKDESGSLLEGWIRIPSQKNDPVNFEKNVDKLKALSHKSWCTKSTHANPYLEKGDFHVYYESGEPKLGVRFDGDTIQEIQGGQNNQKIPLNYLETVQEFVAKNKFKGAEEQLEKAQMRKIELEKIKVELGDSIKEKDYKKILDYFGFNPKVLEDNTLEISTYRQPSSDFAFKDLDIDENDLFKKISKICANADFRYSNVTDLGQLQSIGGDGDFRDSKITDLGQLQSIGGTAYFYESNVTNLGQLQSIGRIAYFHKSNVTNLGQLQSIGGTAYFDSSNVTDLGQLQSIGRDVIFSDSKVTNLGQLQSIGHDADFENSNVVDLGQLQSIGGDADFKNSNVVDLGQLQSIGGNACFENSIIKDWSKVEIKGGVYC